MTVTISENSIPLPKKLLRKWQGKKVTVEQVGDRLVVMLTGQPRILTAWRKLKPLANTVTQKEIRDAIAAVRRENAPDRSN